MTLDKDIAYRVLSRHYRPLSGGNGPSRLTFLGQVTDSLWSVDLYRCESAMLKFHWVLLVMDHYTRRTVGFEAHAGIVDGPALCSMFNRAIHMSPDTPGSRVPITTCYIDFVAGNHIAGAYTKHQWLHEDQFAMDTLVSQPSK